MSETMTSNSAPKGTALRDAALLTAGVAAASLLASSPAAAQTAHTKAGTLTLSNLPGTGDVQILNYALALEQLEADLYRQAYARLTNGTNYTDGKPATSGIGTAIPGLNLPATNPSVQYLGVFAKVEAAHRDFLTAALTAASPSNVVKPFLYDFGIDKMSELQVVQLIYAVEGTGVQAYLGAIPFFTPQSPYLQTAASIQATEARHTAATAIVLNSPPLSVTPPIETAPLVGEGYKSAGIDNNLTPNTVLAAVSGPNGYIYTS